MPRISRPRFTTTGAKHVRDLQREPGHPGVRSRMTLRQRAILHPSQHRGDTDSAQDRFGGDMNVTRGLGVAG